MSDMVQTEKQIFYHWTLAEAHHWQIASVPIFDLERREHWTPNAWPKITYQIEVQDCSELLDLALNAGTFAFNDHALRCNGVSVTKPGSGRVVVFAETIPYDADEDPVHPTRRHGLSPAPKPVEKKPIDFFAINKSMAGR